RWQKVHCQVVVLVYSIAEWYLILDNLMRLLEDAFQHAAAPQQVTDLVAVGKISQAIEPEGPQTVLRRVSWVLSALPGLGRFSQHGLDVHRFGDRGDRIDMLPERRVVVGPCSVGHRRLKVRLHQFAYFEKAAETEALLCG